MCCNNRYYQPKPHEDRDRIIEEQDRRRRGEHVAYPQVGHTSRSDTSSTEETPDSSDDGLIDNRDSDEITVESSSNEEGESSSEESSEEEEESSDSNSEDRMAARLRKKRKFFGKSLTMKNIAAKCLECGNLEGPLFEETSCSTNVFCNTVCQLKFHTNSNGFYLSSHSLL